MPLPAGMAKLVAKLTRNCRGKPQTAALERGSMLAHLAFLNCSIGCLPGR